MPQIAGQGKGGHPSFHAIYVHQHQCSTSNQLSTTVCQPGAKLLTPRTWTKCRCPLSSTWMPPTSCLLKVMVADLVESSSSTTHPLVAGTGEALLGVSFRCVSKARDPPQNQAAHSPSQAVHSSQHSLANVSRKLLRVVFFSPSRTCPLSSHARRLCFPPHPSSTNYLSVHTGCVPDYTLVMNDASGSCLARLQVCVGP